MDTVFGVVLSVYPRRRSVRVVVHGAAGPGESQGARGRLHARTAVDAAKAESAAAAAMPRKSSGLRALAAPLHSVTALVAVAWK
eukprot:5600914-Pleurochrysis_carterae.AAC.3